MTDGENLGNSTQKDIETEQMKHKDLILLPMSPSIKFGHRLLHQLKWATNYNFDYFVRVDDDVFLCFDRLLYDLQFTPVTKFIWGWFHCIQDLVRPDENTLIISYDVVHTFLSQQSMVCHPMSDQQIAIWVEFLQMHHIYYHHPGIMHDPPASSIVSKLRQENICDHYSALHGTYPKEMKIFWKHRGIDRKEYPRTHPIPMSDYCFYPLVLKWWKFDSKWRFAPEFCHKDSNWKNSNLIGSNETFYQGREKLVDLKKTNKKKKKPKNNTKMNTTKNTTKSNKKTRKESKKKTKKESKKKTKKSKKKKTKKIAMKGS